MLLVDANGYVYGFPGLEVTGPDGKPKTLGGGGGPTGPAGGDLSGSYPNPGVSWVNGLSTYNLSYYPLSSNPAGYITGITSLDVTTALGYIPVNQAGDSMLGFLTLNADPTSALHAATKQYVDNLSAGINFHSPCHVATTGNLSATYLNGVSGVGATLTSTVNVALVIDSHTLSVGERVLVWQQSAGLENGIYVVTDAGSVSTPWILTRAADADNSPTGELQNGDFTFIQQGATYGGFGFILNTTGAITVGTTAINYVQFNAAQVVTAGFGLQELTPNVLSVDTSVIATVASLGSYLTSATAAATYYPLTNPSGYISGITSLDVTTALGYTPYDSSNPAGYITSAALSGYLTSAAAAATYYPLSNPSGYITGITSLDVTTALGFTPYNTTNPAGYITGITSGDVTTALGYTPYDAANPAGYITSAALSPYLTSATAVATYYPLSNPAGYTSNTGTVTSVAALTIGTTGTDLSSTVANSTTTPVITLNVPTASATDRGALSSADWSTFNGKQDALVSGTNIKTINGSSVLGSGNLTVGITPRKINGVTFDATADISVDYNIAFFQQMGSQIKAVTLGRNIAEAALNPFNFASQQTRYIYVPITVGQTITGVKFYQSTQGVYTANNYNGVGLYTISGGTLTLVASSTNDGNIWKGTANSWQTKAFTTPYIASSGPHFLAFLYCSSAQTTAPALINYANLPNNNFLPLDFTNSVKLMGTITAQTALPATQAMSGVSNNIGAGIAAFLY